MGRYHWFPKHLHLDLQVKLNLNAIIYFNLVRFMLYVFIFILAFSTQRDEDIFSSARLLLDMFGEDDD